jgi:hypothetical protein
MRMSRRPVGEQRVLRGTGLAVAAREAGDPLAGGARSISSGLVDRRRLAARAGDGVGLEVDLKLVLGDRPLPWRAAVDRRQHRDRALFQQLAGLDVAVGGVADQPLRAPPLGLLVDERSGLVAVVLVGRRDRDRGQERRLGRGGGVELGAGEAPRRGRAAVAHLGVMGGDDRPRPATPAQARHLVVFVLELLADDLAQQPRSLGVRRQLVVLLDRFKRAHGVPCHRGQQLHAGGPVVPVAVRLLPPARVVEAKPRAGLRAAGLDRVEQPSDPERTSVAVSWTAAAPSIAVESTICSASPSIRPSPLASSSERSKTSRPMPWSSSRARKRTRPVG